MKPAVAASLIPPPASVGRVAGPNSSFGPVGWGAPQRKLCSERPPTPASASGRCCASPVTRPTLPTASGGLSREKSRDPQRTLGALELLVLAEC